VSNLTGLERPPYTSAMLLHYNQLAGKNLDRLSALSDGIFAFSMTILFLDIRFPSRETVHTGQELIAVLVSLLPHVLTWLMSILTLGIFWVGQQTQLSLLKTSNRDYAWMQIALLAVTTAIPFSTRLLSEFITFRLALLVYWTNLAILGFIIYISWSYAWREELVKKEVTREAYHAVNRRVLMAQVFYAIGTALCVLNNYWSISFIVLMQLNYAIAPRVRWLARLTA